MTRRHVIVGIVLFSLCVTGIVSAQDPDRDAIISAVIAASEPNIIQSLDAPDGSLRAGVTVYPCVEIGDQIVSYERLDLINVNLGETQLIADQVINCGGLGAFGLWVRRWSDDGAYLYYTDAREGVPDGLSAGWVPPMIRVHTADLHVEELGRALFSPDGTWVAAWGDIHIRLMTPDSADPMVLNVLVPDLPIVDLIWLPDSSGLITIQADSRVGPVSRSVVVHLDLATMAQTLLLDTVNDESEG